MGEPTCNVCGYAESIGVCAVPGVPYSAAYCAACLQANAHPWDILVANTWACGGLDETNAYWREMVAATCQRLGRSLSEFEAAVAAVDGEEEGNNAADSGTPPVG